MTTRAGGLLIGGCLLAASCTAGHHLQVRAIPIPGESSNTGDTLLAQARGELALGNVGLALESFRALQREQPERSDTFEGIAECYAAMGRYDLARTNLEFALAYAPNDSRLLTQLAVTLEKIGEHDQALEALTEASRLHAPSPTGSSQSVITPIGVARTGSLTVKLPERSNRTVTDATNHKESIHSYIGLTAAASQDAKLTSETAISKSKVRETRASEMPARPIDRTEESATRSEAPAVPKGAPPTQSKSPLPALAVQALLVEATRPRERTLAVPQVERGPHLERASRAEVTLVTTVAKNDGMLLDHISTRNSPTIATRGKVRPGGHTKALAEVSVRWVPLKAPQPVELLNAARFEGLAADAREELINRGWRKVGIGNASRARASSLVLYGKGRLQLARRLASQFRCKIKRIENLKTVIVLLGRDVVRQKSTQARA